MAKETIYQRGRLRGSKLEYADGAVGVGIWYPFHELLDEYKDDPDDSTGVSFEIDLRDLEDAITLLQLLRDKEADKIVELDDPEEYEEGR